MHTLIAITLRICFRFGLLVLAFAFAFAFPGLAHASLPQPSNVSGGVAIIPLGSVSASADTLQTWFGDQPVLVTSDHELWYAVVGLSLDMTPGAHELRVKIGDVTKMQNFVVNTKKLSDPRQSRGSLNSSTGAAFQVNLNQVNVGWKKRSVSTIGLSGGLVDTRCALYPPYIFGSGSYGLGNLSAINTAHTPNAR